MDWSLLGCGRAGHVTYAPDDTALRAQLSAVTPAGQAWRCLRCGTFAPGPPLAAGPAAQAPGVRRGREARSALILRLFAIERFIRALVIGAAAVAVWRFSVARESLQQAFDRTEPDLRRVYVDLGFSFQHSKLIGLVRHALKLSPGTLELLAIALAAYAVIEVVEGTGLWLLRRWGEYFAMIATSVFLPYEIYDLTNDVTVLRLVTFGINLLLVLYLVISKRLFGLRGGRRAYEEQLRESSIMAEAAAAAAAQEGTPGAPDLVEPAPAADGRAPAPGEPPTAALPVPPGEPVTAALPVPPGDQVTAALPVPPGDQVRADQAGPDRRS